MLTRISKVLLLVAVLATLVVSSAPAFGIPRCACVSPFAMPHPGRCQFDKNTSQCINIDCSGFCI